jgi:hypothetical protein
MGMKNSQDLHVIGGYSIYNQIRTQNDIAVNFISCWEMSAFYMKHVHPVQGPNPAINIRDKTFCSNDPEYFFSI